MTEEAKKIDEENEKKVVTEKLEKRSNKKKLAGKKHSKHEKKEPMGNIVYTIPLRKSLKKPMKKRANYSMNLIKDFLKMHTKASEIKLGRNLNEYMWSCGRKNSPHKVRVHVIRDGSVAKAELVGHAYVTFTAKKKQERAKGLMDKMKSRVTPKELQKQSEEALAEGKKKEEEKPAAPETKSVEEAPKAEKITE